MALQKDTSINFFFFAHAKLQGDIKIHIYSKVACSSSGFLHPLIHLSFESCLCYKRSAEKSRLEDRWFLLFLNKLQFFLFQGIEIKTKFLYEEENPTKMSCHNTPCPYKFLHFLQRASWSLNPLFDDRKNWERTQILQPKADI